MLPSATQHGKVADQSNRLALGHDLWATKSDTFCSRLISIKKMKIFANYKVLTVHMNVCKHKIYSKLIILDM
jgi:hypothetical protein